MAPALLSKVSTAWSRTTVGTNALLTRRGEDRHHHHGRLPRCAGDAPAGLIEPGASGALSSLSFPGTGALRWPSGHPGGRHRPHARGSGGGRGRRPAPSRSLGCRPAPVVFVNAYANPETERVARAAVEAVWLNPHVTTSSDILPEIREFERTSTATLNAYLQPTVGNCLEALESTLRSDGFGGEVLIVQSNGGVAVRRHRPPLSGEDRVEWTRSGGDGSGSPIGEAAGFPNLITCDMGGTSFDVSLIADGQAALAPQTSIDFRHGRPDPDDRDRDHRCRRRIDRPG